MLYKLLLNVIFCFLVIGANVASAAEVSNQNASKVITPGASSQQAMIVSINSADYTALQKIKGISKTKAKAIVSYREKNGQFKSVDDLLKVKCRGIHKKWLDKVGKFLTV